MRQRFHSEARAEFLAAVDWYGRERAELGREFVEQVSRGLDTLASQPEAWPVFLREKSFSLRRFVLPRFPYSILYAVRDGDVLVVAVAHAKRRPGYWRSRIASED